MKLPKRVRITRAFDGREVGEEYEVNGIIKAGGYVFYPIKKAINHEEDLLYGHKCEVIEYHESA